MGSGFRRMESTRHIMVNAAIEYGKSVQLLLQLAETQAIHQLLHHIDWMILMLTIYHKTTKHKKGKYILINFNYADKIKSIIIIS